MRLSSICAFAALSLLAGCTGGFATKPAEMLDERTGITVGALENPIEFVQNAQYTPMTSGKRASFAYLGPIEWDKSGELSYSLWVHVAPGNDKPVDDIRTAGAVTVILDDGPVELTPVDAPPMGGPYRPIASWGQTSYYALNVSMLKRLAASRKLSITFRATDDSQVEFVPTHEPGATLTQFLEARGIGGD